MAGADGNALSPAQRSLLERTLRSGGRGGASMLGISGGGGGGGGGSSFVQPSSPPEEAAPARQPLFNLDIDIKADHSERIVVCLGDEPHALAKEFVEKHGLPESKVRKLEKLLRQNMELHRNKRNFR